MRGVRGLMHRIFRVLNIKGLRWHAFSGSVVPLTAMLADRFFSLAPVPPTRLLKAL